MGEVGMSLSANSLALGCDCRGGIFYVDGTLNDSVGRAVTTLNAVCMHEVDYGIVWKRTGCRTQESRGPQSAPGISMICTAQGFVSTNVCREYNQASSAS
jgi:primary-amine oxidase